MKRNLVDACSPLGNDKYPECLKICVYESTSCWPTQPPHNSRSALGITLLWLLVWPLLWPLRWHLLWPLRLPLLWHLLWPLRWPSMTSSMTSFLTYDLFYSLLNDHFYDTFCDIFYDLCDYHTTARHRQLLGLSRTRGLITKYEAWQLMISEKVVYLLLENQLQKHSLKLVIEEIEPSPQKIIIFTVLQFFQYLISEVRNSANDSLLYLLWMHRTAKKPDSAHNYFHECWYCNVYRFGTFYLFLTECKNSFLANRGCYYTVHNCLFRSVIKVPGNEFWSIHDPSKPTVRPSLVSIQE